jgi:hypothetical protein
VRQKRLRPCLPFGGGYVVSREILELFLTIAINIAPGGDVDSEITGDYTARSWFQSPAKL